MVCAICGETSHLTRDCPERHNKKKVEESRKRDLAYLEFISELDGDFMHSEKKEEAKNLPPPPVMPTTVPIPVPESDDMQLDDPSDGHTIPGSVIPSAPAVVTSLPTPLHPGSVLPSLPPVSLPSMAVLTTPILSAPPSLPVNVHIPPTPSQLPPVPIIRPGSITYASTPSLTWQQQQALLSNMRIHLWCMLIVEAMFAAMFPPQQK